MLQNCLSGRLLALSITLLLSLFWVGCEAPDGTFFHGALGAGEPRIVVSNALAGAVTLAVYDLDGRLLTVLGDYTSTGSQPRGLVGLDAFSFLVAIDGPDMIQSVNLLGGSSTFVSDNNLTGNIYDIARVSNGDVFVVETNAVESFSAAGSRIGNPRVGTTIGSCVLNTPRGLTVNSSGYLITVATGNDDLNVYDVSNPGATSCVRANTSFGNVDPFAVIAHSDGNLYVATQGDDRIYQFSGDGSGTGTSIFSNTAVINNPSALLELPDGTVLVASDGTNAIERIDTAGNRVGSSSFILNAFTGTVTSMILLSGDE